MIEKVAFTLIPVVDATRARAFYEDTLGLVRGSHSPQGTWTEYDLPGGGCLALFAGEGRSQPSTSVGGSVALEVTDLDVARERLKARGVRFLDELITSPVCRMAVIEDSEGNAVILHQLNAK